MVAYIIRRIIYIIPVLFLISLISFLVIQAPPGDYLTSQMERLEQQYGSAVREQIATLRKRYGLGEPLHIQYFKWISNIILRGDFGRSFAEERSVRDILRTRIPLTVLITLVTFLFTWSVAIPIGVYSAVKQYTPFDYIFTFIAFIGRSIPNFLLALVLLYVFYTNFGMKLGGLFSQQFQGAPWSLAKLLDLARHMIIPIIVIGTAGTAGMVRVLRGMMLDELNKEYIQTARSKGLNEWVVIWKHAFKIAMLPIISTIGWLLPRLFSGAMITAIVLNLPTTGEALYRALMNQDMYVASSVVLLLSTLVIVGTLISDILLAWIDPRIRYD